MLEQLEMVSADHGWQVCVFRSGLRHKPRLVFPTSVHVTLARQHLLGQGGLDRLRVFITTSCCDMMSPFAMPADCLQVQKVSTVQTWPSVRTDSQVTACNNPTGRHLGQVCLLVASDCILSPVYHETIGALQELRSALLRLGPVRATGPPCGQRDMEAHPLESFLTGCSVRARPLVMHAAARSRNRQVS